VAQAIGDIVGASYRRFDVSFEYIQNLGKDLVDDVGVTTFNCKLKSLVILFGLQEVWDLLLD
jgi:hypothetical protein